MLVRLNEQRFLTLAALANGPRHGYAIAEEIRSLSDGHHTPRPGSLYHALDKLVEQALVEMDREEVVGGRLRRYYRLTARGAETVATEAARRATTAHAALERVNDVSTGWAAS